MSTQRIGPSLQPANKKRPVWNQIRLDFELVFKDPSSWLTWTKNPNTKTRPLVGRQWSLLTNDNQLEGEKVIKKLLREYFGREPLAPMDEFGELLNSQYPLVEAADHARPGWKRFDNPRSMMRSLLEGIISTLPELETANCKEKENP